MFNYIGPYKSEVSLKTILKERNKSSLTKKISGFIHRAQETFFSIRDLPNNKKPFLWNAIRKELRSQIKNIKAEKIILEQLDCTVQTYYKEATRNLRFRGVYSPPTSRKSKTVKGEG